MYVPSVFVSKHDKKWMLSSGTKMLADPVHTVHIIIMCISGEGLVSTKPNDIMFCKSAGNLLHIPSKYRFVLFIYRKVTGSEICLTFKKI